MRRRDFLENSSALLLAAIFATPGFARTVREEEAFRIGSLEAIYSRLGARSPKESEGIRIEAPDVAEDGGRVRVVVRIDLPAPERLLLLGDRNPIPLMADVHFLKAEPVLEIDVRLADTSRVHALVFSRGQWYGATRQVQVIAGGCSG